MAEFPAFPAQDENVSAQRRRRLHLQPYDPLEASALAAELGVIAKTPQEIPGVGPETLRVLLHDDPDSWSAVTISEGGKDLVILNPSHRGGRPNSNLMHELSHLLLGHKPGQTFISGDGELILSAYNKPQEDEASWLAGALLLPRPALLHIHRRRLPEADVIQRYNVSADMLRYRANVTGVDRQMKRRSGGRVGGR